VRILAIAHHADAGPGVFGEAALAGGHEIVEWFAPTSPAPTLDGFGAVIVLGGAMHVDQEDANPWLRDEKALLREMLDGGVPLLGVCLGSQLLAEVAGASPRAAAESEIGWHEIELTADAAADPVIGPLPTGVRGFQWHHYEAPLPPGAVALAQSRTCLQAFRLPGSSYGIQFHAEVTHRDLNRWLDDWDTDHEAVESGLDPEAIRAESAGRIGDWNEVGRGIARRFLEAAQQGRTS
jgi:GMP synthase-like glutamine amidotransferase